MANLVLLLALTMCVGEPACCAMGDCCHEVRHAEHKACSCCPPASEPSPHAPCDCDDHREVSTPPAKFTFDIELVAVFDLDTTIAAATIPSPRAPVPEALSPPAAPHAGLTLPLLL